MSRLRATIAKRLKEAQDNAAMLTTFNEVDMKNIMQMREDYQEDLVKKYCYEAAELLNKYDMLWYAGGVRVTNVTKEDLLHYKNNGCISIKFGIESGSQTMLDIMEKKFKTK